MKLPQYFLEKPRFSSSGQKEILTKFQKYFKDDAFREIFERVNTPEYLYWDTIKHKIRIPELKTQELWFLIRQFRNFISTETILTAESGKKFQWIRLPYTDEYLHKIDMYGGSLSPLNSQQIIIHGIMEEAIASSQLEGAHTTRAVAKKMLLEKRAPKNESEQMILNNYRTIMAIQEQYRNSELSLDLIFSLHHQLTDGIIPLEQQARLRTDNDEIVVQGFIGTQQYISHIPPKELFLKKEIQRLIDFANDTEGQKFMHPIIKAIFLHFWIGYLHPFTDGNGRLARALFYWYLLKKGYWAMPYVSISTVIKKSPIQYAMAYIYAEQDNFDLTYFYDFHIRKIIQSLGEFERYLARKLKENHVLDEKLGENMDVNDRQKRLLHYLLSAAGGSVTMTSHSELNNITRQTAAKDLKTLEMQGILIAKREGKSVRYYAGEKLKMLQ